MIEESEPLEQLEPLEPLEPLEQLKQSQRSHRSDNPEQALTMEKIGFDAGEVVHLTGWQYIRRVSYFVTTTLAAIGGAIGAGFQFWLSPVDAIFVLPIAFVATALGANTAYHMYFTHASFSAGRRFRIALALLGTLLCQDSIGQWVANHKRHHRHVDIADKDPHTPLQFGTSRLKVLTLGVFWASAGWKFSRVAASKKFYARSSMQDPVVGWFDRHFAAISLAGLWLPFAAGLAIGGVETGVKGFAYFGGLRIFIGYFFTEFVTNGLCHSMGSRRFQVRGRSRNILFLAPFTLGATLHHNHHAFPRLLSPSFDGDIDTMAPLYWILQKLRVIDPVPRPSAVDIDAKRIRFSEVASNEALLAADDPVVARTERR